ncbi:MAG: MGMT family protein [Oscillospiraceae bacterium]
MKTKHKAEGALPAAVFNRRIYALVAQIPAGRVASYGQLAILAGKPRAARQAGRALHYAPPQLSCHRVVNSTGGTAPGWAEQQQLLQQEGVVFTPGGKVNMKLCRWRPEKTEAEQAGRAHSGPPLTE